MESKELDDSVCILYENIRPPPEIEVVREVFVLNDEENVPNVEESSQESVVDICDDSSDTDIARDSSCNIIESTAEDDSISVLHEQNRVQPKRVHDVAKATDSSNSRENKKTKIQCGICFDGLEEISASHRVLGSTICGHIFCDACMALSRSNSTQCPSCRKRLGKNQFHPIYLNL